MSLIRSALKHLTRYGYGTVAAIRLAALTLALSVAVWAQDEQPEYAVKTAFIFNFLKFTQWPGTVLPKPDSPITVCTVGADPFGNTLNILTTKHVDSHPIILQRMVSEAAAATCNVIVMGQWGANQVPLVSYRGHPILTIGDGRGFASAGGMIGLISVDHQIRFEINANAIHRSGLSVSSQLLKIAILVDTAT